MKRFEEKTKIPVLSEMKKFLSAGIGPFEKMASEKSDLAILGQIFLLFLYTFVMILSIWEFLFGLLVNKIKNE